MISVADPEFESAMWWALIPSVWTAKISDVTLLLPSAPCPRPPQLPDGTPNPKYQFCGIIDNSGTPLPQLFLAFLKSPEISAVSEENS